MFNKLISNLPFNPSLIDQVSFYAKRLRKESGIRRVGFTFIALTFLVQAFAVMSPAEASLSCDPSGNDIIQCGFKTKEEAVNHCRNNDQNFSQILNHYGISCDNLAGAGTQTISSNAYNNQLISMGRKPFRKSGEFAINVPGVPGNLFMRPLSSWGSFSTKVLATKTADGQLVMVMYECGNIVTLKDFKKFTPEPDSDLKVVKSNSPTGNVKPGDVIDYTLAFTNKGGTAAFFSVNDVLPSTVSFVSSQHGNWIFENKSPNLKWYNNTPPFYTFGNTDAFGTPGFIFLKVRVNDRVPSGTTICNRAYLQDVPKGGSGTRNTSEVQVCNTVQIICPEGELLQDDGLTCKKIEVPDAQCVTLTAIGDPKDNTNKKYSFETRSSAVQGAKIESYTYNFGDGSTKTNKNTTELDKVDHEFKQPKTYDVSVKVKTSVADKPALTCKTKVVINPPEEEPVLALSKKARNVTQSQADANNQTANAGDVIEYSLTTRNVSNVDSKDTVLQPEDLTDVLEYSDLDLNSLQGGTFDNATKVLSWNQKITIKAKESITKTFRVTVKNPIPSTPSPATQSNRSAGDMLMQNIYGESSVTIKLPTTPIKTIERTTETLPNTGPGTSLLIGFVTVSVVGYFYSRSRLLAQELDIVKHEYTTSGGL